MKILFIGPHKPYNNDAHIQYLILKKIYKNVDVIHPYKSFFFPFISLRVFQHINPNLLLPFINNYILSRVKKKYDLIYVKVGELISEKLILKLKTKTKKIVFYCNDNPFVKRDKNKWILFLRAAKYYDLITYHDYSRIKLSRKIGLKNSLLVTPPYDKKIHRRQKLSNFDKKKFKNDVVFVATWSPQKGIFLKKLIDLGLKVKIYGTRWDKDPNYKSLKSVTTLCHLSGKNYSKVIQSAKIALCLFAEGNLDTITTRSTEIPAIGTLLFSLRTTAMKNILIEKKEAIYFNNPNECFKKCIFYLKNHNIAKKIAMRGHKKITRVLKISNDDLIKKIINKVFEKKNES
jgi:spore maturation protein CgeB